MSVYSYTHLGVWKRIINVETIQRNRPDAIEMCDILQPTLFAAEFLIRNSFASFDWITKI